MKRFLRIFVPIMLAVTVLISVGWYFFKYDPDTTRDLLVSQARYLDDRGNHSLATWFYKLAYLQSGNDETVALELSEQYRSMGNYTKAEYTLTNAIADGGSVELYIALCKLYIEQDKLFDAVNMLDNVANPIIKAQLQELRPAAPVPSHEPGYYNQYITLSFTSVGKLYTTTDGSYPTTHADTYSVPISLSAGETVVYALAIGENGLVSPLSILNYTVAGVIEQVVIEDPAMDLIIREILQVGSDHALYSNELWSITELTVPKEAQDLSDLSKLPFLKSLTMDGMEFDNLSVMSGLTALEELILSDMPLSDSDLKTIAALPNLKFLAMVQCSLSSIAPLAEAKGLTALNIGGNTIRDLSALESMAELTHLYLNHNAVTDLNSLSKLKRLEVLDLSFNSITTPAPLSGCIKLRELDLSNNSLTDLDGIGQLNALEKLSLMFTGLTDVSSIAANTSLTDLNISNNSLTDISALSNLNQLKTLDFSYNQVEKLPEFSKDAMLVSIKGSKNNLSSLEELRGLQCLNYVKLDYNEAITSAEPLEKCYTLVELNVYGTGIRDVDVLKQMGVIVIYSPI